MICDLGFITKSLIIDLSTFTTLNGTVDNVDKLEYLEPLLFQHI